MNKMNTKRTLRGGGGRQRVTLNESQLRNIIKECILNELEVTPPKRGRDFNDIEKQLKKQYGDYKSPYPKDWMSDDTLTKAYKDGIKLKNSRNNKSGFNTQSGIHKDTYTKYDPEGYDIKGYDREGYNREGYNNKGYDRFGISRNGMRHSYDKNGFNKQSGIHKDTLTKYNNQGLDINGYDIEGNDRYGYNKDTGYNKAGYDRFGIHKNGYVLANGEIAINKALSMTNEFIYDKSYSLAKYSGKPNTKDIYLHLCWDYFLQRIGSYVPNHLDEKQMNKLKDMFIRDSKQGEYYKNLCKLDKEYEEREQKKRHQEWLEVMLRHGLIDKDDYKENDKDDDYDADEYESENIFPDWESGSDDYPAADMHYENGKSKFDPY